MSSPARRSVPRVDDQFGLGSLYTSSLALGSQGALVVPRTRTTGFGPRSFSVAGPLAYVEQSAAGNQDITDTRTVLWPAEN